MPALVMQPPSRAETPLQSFGKADAPAPSSLLQTEPHEKSLRVGRQQLENLVYHLNIIPHNDTVDGAHRLYKMAVTKEGFTRGRRRGEVRWTLRRQLCRCSRLCRGLVICRLPVLQLAICLCSMSPLPCFAVACRQGGLLFVQRQLAGSSLCHGFQLCRLPVGQLAACAAACCLPAVLCLMGHCYAP